MARISTYNKDISPSLKDKVIGSNFGGSETYNYPLKDIGELFANLGATGIAGQLNFEFQHDLTGGRKSGSISFDQGQGLNTALDSITTIKISEKSSSQKVIIDYLNTLLNRNIVIAQIDDINNFCIYNLNSIVQDTVETSFYDLNLTPIEGNGAITEDKYYAIALYSETPSGAVDLSYEYVQLIPSSSWTINHNLNKIPSVTVLDSSNKVVIGEVQHSNLNTTIITFNAPFSGKAYFN